MSQSMAIRSAESLAALRVVATHERRLAERCEDPFATHFLGLRNRILKRVVPHALLRRCIDAAMPGSYCFTIARTRHFDEVLRGEMTGGAAQAVILGAGYDSRTWRLADALDGVPVLEVDHPGTQARKRGLMEAAGIPLPANLRFLPVDFNRTSLAEALADAGFDRSLKTVFLWEGVSYYLPQPAVEAVLDVVGSCASGSSILLDYAIRRFVEGDTSTYGGKALARWLKRIGEPFLFGLDATETAGFMAGRGLRLVSDLSPEDVERAYLGTRTGGCLGRTLGHVRMAHARVP